MEVKIRNAKLNEAAAIYRQLLRQEKKEAYTKDLVRELIKNKKHICLIAILNNRIIGCIGARREGYKAYWIYFIEVKKEYRDKGIGKLLMKEMIRKSRVLKASKIATDTPNKRFLLKFNFREVGKLPNWYKNKTQFIMFKKI